MYFPYLRGKQFEIIALRELMEKGLLSKRILPIIEPIKLTTTLKKTIELFSKNQAKMALVCNPQVGGLIGDGKEIIETYQNYFINHDTIPACILTPNITENIWLITDTGLSKENVIVVHVGKDLHQHYNKEFLNATPMYNLIPESLSYSRKITDNTVIFENRFEQRERNSDYANFPDEDFSDDHLIFNEGGYRGFSDYSIVGKKYTESGFAPYAVAIHITYFDNEENLRVKHFVSDSNEDIADTPKKFEEALNKLIDWYNPNDNINNSLALKLFKEHHERGSYPGLGVVKKLSIMHHLEIMGNYLDRK